MKKTKLGKIIKKVYDKINSKEFLEVSKMKEKDFTRNRKMDFPKLTIFILSGTKKSLQSALFAFSSRFKFENGTYSKQAFSKARKKINPSAFFSIFKESVEMFYKDSDLHDFYATMFLNNIASIMALDCEEEIKEHCKTNQLKYEYKANISLTISMMKFRLIDMFTVKSQSKRKKILDNIYHQLLISVTPIRPNRTFARTKKHKAQKFPYNRKSL